MKKLSLHDLDLKGKKVLMRVDFNVPLNEALQITDDTRIVASLPSIEYVINQGGSLVLMSHLGRPGSSRNPKYSLNSCAKHLSELLNKQVYFAPDCIGSKTHDQVQKLQSGEILLLENLRFHEAELHPEKDPDFAKELATYGDYFVNDAFGTAHRKHSSNVEIAKYFEGKASTGFLIEKEISFLAPLSINPKRPFCALIGGAKIGSKIGVIKALVDKVDAFFIGGGMAFTFLKAQNIEIGSSIFEEDQIEAAKDLIKECSEKAVKLYLPKDLVITKEISETAEFQTILTKDGIPTDSKGVDIGPQTTEEWLEPMSSSSTVFWNGPMGICEISHFAKGTETLAKNLSSTRATTIVGGGDSVAAINKLGLSSHFTHISTGGGASLEFIEKGHLPAIDALSDH
ncbi:MAG: phosphoglycerate kinase [Simkaniaceae bacterium]|nr:phosphoglycerate kinase [Simkaniaceae bacterium]